MAMIYPSVAATASLTQKLSPAMQVSNEILQMTGVELAEHIQSELESNPFIEERRGAGPEAIVRLARGSAVGRPTDIDPVTLLEAPASLADHLAGQLGFLKLGQQDRAIAAYLIAMLDEDGYLRDDPHELADLMEAPHETVLHVLDRLQTLDPPGVFARSLVECLRLQVRDEWDADTPLIRLIDALGNVDLADMAALARCCDIVEDEVPDVLRRLKGLATRPARGLVSERIEAIQPDVFLFADGEGHWRVEVNERLLPRIVLNQGYYQATRGHLTRPEDRDFATGCYSRASWLLACIARRADTVTRVAACLAERQAAFLEKGMEHLRPLTLQDVAKEVGLHLSTISRVTSNKYVATPQGILPMKRFFTRAVSGGKNAGISASFVKARLARLVADEPPSRPLSDEQIQNLLGKSGIHISRRAVTKYREQIDIPSSRVRLRQRVAAHPCSPV